MLKGTGRGIPPQIKNLFLHLKTVPTDPTQGDPHREKWRENISYTGEDPVKNPATLSGYLAR
jgi:cell division protein FtsI/penicillin-binding protein 2